MRNMMFLTVLLLGYLAALQLTAAYPYKSEPTRAPSRLQGTGKIENDGGGEENTVCIIYKDSGEKECHPIDESGDVVSMQKVGAQVLSGCVFLEYFLGYTKVTYEACGNPVPCLVDVPICNPKYQGYPLGAPQYVFLGASFQLYEFRLTANSQGLCMIVSPELQTCGPCLEAGFTSCCTTFNCEVPSGGSTCYCDQACYFFDDCCSDIGSICLPLAENQISKRTLMTASDE